ncbi:MAG: ATP-binding protein [Vulcanimicrobiota bacterium]
MKIIEKNIKNDISELGVISEIIEDLRQDYNLKEETVFTINLVLDELITNIIRHGYNDECEHYIDLVVCADEDDSSIILRLMDDGEPFNPLDYPEPDIHAPLEERKPGNMGIHLVKNMTDDLKYRRENGKNILLIKKKVAFG